MSAYGSNVDQSEFTVVSDFSCQSRKDVCATLSSLPGGSELVTEGGIDFRLPRDINLVDLCNSPGRNPAPASSLGRGILINLIHWMDEMKLASHMKRTRGDDLFHFLTVIRGDPPAWDTMGTLVQSLEQWLQHILPKILEWKSASVLVTVSPTVAPSVHVTRSHFFAGPWAGSGVVFCVHLSQRLSRESLTRRCEDWSLPIDDPEQHRLCRLTTFPSSFCRPTGSDTLHHVLRVLLLR